MEYTLASLNVLNNYASIDERLPRIDVELDRLRPDVFLAQEALVQPDTAAMLDGITAVFEGAEMATAVRGALGSSKSGNAIFYRPERFTVVETGAIAFAAPDLHGLVPEAVYAVLQRVDAPFAPPVIALCAHLSWGGDQGALRLANARAIEKRAAELAAHYPGALIFTGGDFNETPDAAAIQFLTGKSAVVPGAFWIDVWPWLHPDEPGFTQIPAAEYTMRTAHQVGIRNGEMIPKRRLDFIMVRGWAYGALGAAPAIEIFGNAPDGDVSDHLGLSFRFDLAD